MVVIDINGPQLKVGPNLLLLLSYFLHVITVFYVEKFIH